MGVVSESCSAVVDQAAAPSCSTVPENRPGRLRCVRLRAGWIALYGCFGSVFPLRNIFAYISLVASAAKEV